MAEYFYNLLSFHHLFDIAVDFSEILLLLQEVFSTLCSETAAYGKHDKYHYKCEYSQRDIQNDHTDKYAYNGDDAGKHLWHTLTDHLAEGIDVVCVDGHNIAVRVRVKVFNRKCFHTGKHIVSKIAKGSLTYINHNAVIGISGSYADGIKAGNLSNGQRQWSKIRCFRL